MHLAFTFYLLSKNPDKLATLRQVCPPMNAAFPLFVSIVSHFPMSCFFSMFVSVPVNLILLGTLHNMNSIFALVHQSRKWEAFGDHEQLIDELPVLNGGGIWCL